MLGNDVRFRRRFNRVHQYRRTILIGVPALFFTLFFLFRGPREATVSSDIDSLHNCTLEILQAAAAARKPCPCELLWQKTQVKLGKNASELAVGKGSLEPVFLFIGILSGRGYRHRRLAVREAWANEAQVSGQSVVKFFLSDDENTPQVQKEQETHEDVVFLNQKTNYASILYKTFFVLDYAITRYDVRFILKTDDDAFVNVLPLVYQLRLLCETPECEHERIYMGRMARNSEVLLTPGHKWNNEIFYNHTGLDVYPNYMMGGGYIISGGVAEMLVQTNRKMQLKFTPIEDATLGFWLMAMDLRHIDHPRFFTWAAPCCFKAPVRKEGQRIVTRFQLQEMMEGDMCSKDPWLVLHKIDSPTKMRYIGNRVQSCDTVIDPQHVAPSILPYLPAGKAAALAHQQEGTVEEH